MRHHPKRRRPCRLLPHADARGPRTPQSLQPDHGRVNPNPESRMSLRATHPTSPSQDREEANLMTVSVGGETVKRTDEAEEVTVMTAVGGAEEFGYSAVVAPGGICSRRISSREARPAAGGSGALSGSSGGEAVASRRPAQGSGAVWEPPRSDALPIRRRAEEPPKNREGGDEGQDSCHPPQLSGRRRRRRRPRGTAPISSSAASWGGS